jgi:hypothetical protein
MLCTEEARGMKKRDRDEIHKGKLGRGDEEILESAARVFGIYITGKSLDVLNNVIRPACLRLHDERKKII